MEITALLFAAVVGFTHAFEADHLVAVGNIVTRRNNPLLAMKDGISWGFGHTSTILLVGSIFIVGKIAMNEDLFRYLEASVGIMLIGLGINRLYHTYKHNQQHTHQKNHAHRLAYGVGLIHGLAGSGAVILSVLTTIQAPATGIAYLLIFGIGSVAGMTIAAGIFSLPFSEKLLKNSKLQNALAIIAALLCIGLGTIVLYENITAA